ncbi:phosphatidylinositol N-acetylglucosaminyltransferase subunit P [Epargyreus clarus]|uniref:phosphatidylinositol N-acetylglucosaminyltransferase subunit P n=1 Tax=Epargyreus clarus TaxID=520877 RepID=UPI003C30D50B
MSEHTPAPTPARSLYGFFMYLLSKTVLAIYLIWALTPDYYLHYFNIYYYPQRYWATAVPIQCLVALTIFAFFVYPSSNLMLTSKIDGISTISDCFSQEGAENFRSNNIKSSKCICVNEKKCKKYSFSTSIRETKEDGVPLLHDLNIRVVCKKLYLNK